MPDFIWILPAVHNMQEKFNLADLKKLNKKMNLPSPSLVWFIETKI